MARDVNARCQGKPRCTNSVVRLVFAYCSECAVTIPGSQETLCDWHTPRDVDAYDGHGHGRDSWAWPSTAPIDLYDPWDPRTHKDFEHALTGFQEDLPF